MVSETKVQQNFKTRLTKYVKWVKKNAFYARKRRNIRLNKEIETTFTHKKMTLKTLLLSGIALSITACGTTKNTQPNDVATKENHPEEIDAAFTVAEDAQYSLAQKNNSFALNLFAKMEGMDSQVMSPLSVTYLMGMLANGTDGQTRQEILSTMGWKDETLDNINAFSRQFIEQATRKDAKTTVHIANYVALNKNEKLKDGIVGTLEQNYKAAIEPLDFSSDQTTGHINAWCSKQTKGMIPSIIDDVDPSALAYIMNAIYFDGTWKKGFKKAFTKEERFQGYTRDVKRVPMMWQSDKFSYTSNDTYAAVILPYAGEEYCMTVFLPNEGKSIAEMMKTINADALTNIQQNSETCIVDLKLPRFTTEMKLQLNDVISQLGAPSMFSPALANFSNLTDKSLHISQMLQKAKIEVSETGTKAAAVTAATVMMTSLDRNEPRYVEFHANRPFVYTITDSQTGAILFIGQFTGE